jgi:hypothetical protein
VALLDAQAQTDPFKHARRLAGGQIPTLIFGNILAGGLLLVALAGCVAP